MSNWISRPADEPRVWHLEAVLPGGRGLVFLSCGLRWAPTEADPIARTGDLNRIRYEVRCATCNAAFARRLPEPEGA